MGDHVGIDVKGTARVTPSDAKGLSALSEETTLTSRIIVCMETMPRTTDDGIRVLPVRTFFSELWAGQLF